MLAIQIQMEQVKEKDVLAAKITFGILEMKLVNSALLKDVHQNLSQMNNMAQKEEVIIKEKNEYNVLIMNFMIGIVHLAKVVQMYKIQMELQIGMVVIAIKLTDGTLNQIHVLVVQPKDVFLDRPKNNKDHMEEKKEEVITIETLKIMIK